MKNKRIFGFLLALVMLLALCSVTALADDAETETYDVDAQLELIFSQLDKLEQKEEENPWFYTVADLDHDGNLEFIAASQHPVDRSTNLRVWEVSEDRTALTECGLDKDPEESFPDIMTDCADTFRDTETDTWYYLFYDNIVLSDTEVYTIKTAVNLKDGIVAYDAFAVEHTLLENSWRTVSYTDINGMQISQEQYNAAGINAFAGTERSSTSFDWFVPEDVTGLARLADSFAMFMGTKEPTEVFPVPQPAALQHPEATPAPTATPQPAVQLNKKDQQPLYLSVTKNPTNENRKEGETAWFVACANAYDSLTWTMVSPNGGEYSIDNFSYMFPKAQISGRYSTTLTIENLVQDMNNWGAYCTFCYKGQAARTTTAFIYVKQKPVPATPKPVAPAQDAGVFYGRVCDYSYDTVTVEVEGIDFFMIPMAKCVINGNIFVNASAAVYYDSRNARGVNVTGCFIDGSHSVQPTYGSMNGTITYVANAYTIYLADGTSVTVSGNICDLASGDYVDVGNSCVVYYAGAADQNGIYYVQIYGSYNPTPQPVYGTVYGTVTYVANAYTISLADGSSVTVSGNVCELVSGDYAEAGNSCLVYYQGNPDQSGIYLVQIYGTSNPTPAPQPQHNYLSLKGTAYRQNESQLCLILESGDTVYVKDRTGDGYECNYYNGDVSFAGAGNRCLVYYMDYLSADTIYKVEIYEPLYSGDSDGGEAEIVLG